MAPFGEAPQTRGFFIGLQRSIPNALWLSNQAGARAPSLGLLAPESCALRLQNKAAGLTPAERSPRGVSSSLTLP